MYLVGMGSAFGQRAGPVRCAWQHAAYAVSTVRTSHAAAAAGILPGKEVGRGGGGESQAKAKQMQAQLAPYDPQSSWHDVSVVHKHGMALLFDPWYNKGTSFASCKCLWTSPSQTTCAGSGTLLHDMAHISLA